ncbi:putative nuclear maintenance protein SRP40 [Chlamydia psittaci 02DC14]|nr:putative nuclear maintenance protein SRP40 [Chlamydia psittaci 02DC14]EPP33659.1 putative nuclear maintenance protein SRP40 [Chlamydia psittaci C6/98]
MSNPFYHQKNLVMKSSVPWLLISSAITFPLSSLANEQAVSSSASQETGEHTLSSSDNYDGSSLPETPFTCKNSSFASGTTYTLTSDVSFTNVSKTQAPASQQSPEAQKNESENTDKQEPSSPSTPATPSDSDDTKDSTDSTGADPHPSPVSPESSTEDTNGDATSPSGDTGATEDKQDKASSEEAGSTKVEEKTEADNEVKEDEKEKEALESSIPHAPLSFTASSDVANENGAPSHETKTAPTATTSQANGATSASCFSNTEGSLTFVGGGHSLTFSNISVTAKGSAINNSAGSALTFSGFKDLSFISATD